MRNLEKKLRAAIVQASPVMFDKKGDLTKSSLPDQSCWPAGGTTHRFS